MVKKRLYYIFLLKKIGRPEYDFLIHIRAKNLIDLAKQVKEKKIILDKIVFIFTQHEVRQAEKRFFGYIIYDHTAHVYRFTKIGVWPFTKKGIQIGLARAAKVHELITGKTSYPKLPQGRKRRKP